LPDPAFDGVRGKTLDGLESGPDANVDDVDNLFEFEMPVFDRSSEMEFDFKDSLQAIISNNTERDMETDIVFRVICIGKDYDDYDKSFSVESKSLAAYSYLDMAVTPADFDLPPLENENDACQFIPIIHFTNGQGYKMQESKEAFFLKNTRDGLMIMNVFPFDRGDHAPEMKSSPEETARMLEEKGSRATVSVNICARWKVNYDDASLNTGDDYFTSNLNKQARGVYLQVYDGYGNYAYYGYVGVNGCTGNINVVAGRDYTVKFKSSATLSNSNKIYVKYYGSSGYTSAYYYRTVNWTTSGTKIVSSSLQDNVSNIAASTGWALYKHNGGMSGKSYTFRYRSTNDNKHSGGYVYLKSFGASRKYITAHEFGHAIMYKKHGGYVGSNYTHNGGGSSCITQGLKPNEHMLTSQEYQSCAMNEGWAHFYSAVTWNNDEETDCKFQYYKDCDHDNDSSTSSSRPLINCESGEWTEYKKWNINICDSPYGKWGNERDWLMTLWDWRTNPTSNVSFNTILNVLSGISGTWSSNEGDLYCRLYDSAESYGVEDELQEVATYNGTNVFYTYLPQCSGI